ncbi:unnamed protein product [Cladocopium goreaui]|uniref:Uncharacterized protein n=1 Tax=Cladocopium goreaui TaxID=2562237 RepID=A0A9P1D4R3_9DINO|nr:unnamed protein product [Cladocopium goreaui]
MADSKQVAAKHQQSLQSRAAERARVEEIERQESRRIQSPNRAGATADSKQVAAKQQSQNRPGATASKQVAAERHQDLQPESEEGHEDYLDDLGRESGEVASEDDLLYPDSKPKPVHESQGRSMQPTQRRRSSEADGEHNGPRRGPVSAGGQSRGSRGSRDSGQAQQRHSQKESELAQRKSLETSGAKASQRSSAAKTSPNVSRSEPGGAGQIPTPEVMSKAARARSLLYVAPKTQGTAPAATAEMSGSLSSTLGVSKKPSRSQPQSQNVQKVQNGKKSPNPTPATTLTEEELARRDSAPPSFLCGRSFGRSDGVLLPLRSKERHVHSLENSPSPTSERGLQDLTRGEQPQLLWERSLSPDARANRSSLISFGKPENFDTGDRSTASKSPGRPVTTSRSPSSRVSPRSHGTPSPMGRSGRSTSPYSNRAIYVSDTPWSRPPPSPVATKAWK